MRKSLKVLLTVLCLVFAVSAFVACGERPETTVVSSPVIASKVYNGEKQTAAIEETEAYTVTLNNGGTDVGEYDVVLTIKDTLAYEWETPDEDDRAKLTLKFAITKAQNAIEGLTLADWNEGATASVPTATAKFGTVKFTYSDAENGTYTETVPTAKGTYYVKASVEGTANYDGAEAVKSFSIIKVKLANAITLTANDMVYGGELSCTATANHVPTGAKVELTFALTEDGEYMSWSEIEKRAGTYYVKATVAEDDDYNGATANGSFQMTKATNAVTFGEIDAIYCGETPELNATATFGTVTYKYKKGADGKYADYTDSVILTNGTYYFKAVVAGTDNYDGVESAEVELTVTHNFVWGSRADGSLSQTCACGYESILALVPNQDVLTKAENGYTLNLYSEAYGEKKNEVTVSFNMLRGETTEATNALLTWTASNNGIVEVTGEGQYTIKMKAVGETVLTGTTNGYEHNPSVKITVKCEKLVETLDIHPVIEVENLTAIALPEGVNGVTAVMLGGENVLASVSGGMVNFDKAKLPKAAANMGEGLEMSFVTAGAEFNFTADVYTLIISNKAELDQMRTLARSNANYTATGVLDGYFVLDSDIDYNGEYEALTNSGTLWGINNNINKANGTSYSWQNTSLYGFKGVFDGKGYNIDSLTVKTYNAANTESCGFIGFMNDKGVFKNVSFTNATVYENSGFICFMGGGLIENVQIQFKQLGKGDAVVGIDSWHPRAMGAFFTFLESETAVINNCVIDAIGAKIYYQVGANKQPSVKLGTKAKGANVHNMVVLYDGENATEILSKSGASALATSYTGLKENSQAHIDKLAESDMWTTVGGLPFLKSLANQIDTTVDVAFEEFETTVNNGGSLSIKANSRYSLITIEGLYEGVTFENGVLTVAEDAVGGTVTAKVVSALNDSFDEVEITIRSTQTVTVAHEKLLLDDETTEVDLSFASAYYTENAELYYGTMLLGKGALNNGKLTVDLSGITDLEDITFVATTYKDNVYYTFNVNVRFATKVIRTAEDLESVRIMQTNIDNKQSITGLFVLANDIDLTGKTYERGLTYNSSENVGIWESKFGFQGTFDGQNHTLSNATVGVNGIFGHIGKGAVIKDVNFTNVTYKAGYLSALLAGTLRDATLDNITVTVKAYTQTGGGIEHSQGLLSSRYMQYNTIKNVKIDASGITVYSVFGRTINGNTLTGCELKIGSFTVLGFNGDETTDANKLTELAGLTIINA